MNTYKIDIQDVTKTFKIESRDVVALKDLTLTVHEKEFMVVVGPSGCGKSTLLNMIAGFEKPTKGKILLNGEEIQKPGPDRGLVFQDFAIYPWKTVLHNVSFGLEAQGIPKDKAREKAREYVKSVGLEGFEDVYPHTLSGGMKQRVGIARAIAYKPDVLLMDEPFVALDAQTRNNLQNALIRVWKKTMNTIVFITHNVDEAVYLGDRVAVMSPRPGTIKEIVDINIERPRDRTDPNFNEIRKKILDLLQHEGEMESLHADE